LESWNGVDDNCNGTTDDGLIFITYYVDSDNDNFGSVLNAGISLCSNPGAGYSVNNTDCNDGNPLINPAAPESCNGMDDNCNIQIDEGLALTVFYQDADNDNFGNASISFFACAAPSGYVADSTDCDDSDEDVFPGAVEILPNGIDDDCDGYIDEISVAVVSPEDYYLPLAIFPNPTYGAFTVYLHLNDKQEPEAKIELTTTAGQVIFNKMVRLKEGELSEEIQMSTFDAAGTYYVKVTIGDKKYIAQMVYQK